MDKVFVLDFGSQYTQLIARKIRELGVYSEILPYNTSLSAIKKGKPSALILSGGPQSVYEKKAPIPAKGILDLGIPVLGICYGLQLMARLLGGKVSPSQKREYGFATLHVKEKSDFLSGLKSNSQVWMSHGDRVNEVPGGFCVTGRTENCEATVIEWAERKFFGVQFHPESIITEEGYALLNNFCMLPSG